MTIDAAWLGDFNAVSKVSHQQEPTARKLIAASHEYGSTSDRAIKNGLSGG